MCSILFLSFHYHANNEDGDDGDDDDDDDNNNNNNNISFGLLYILRSMIPY